MDHSARPYVETPAVPIAHVWKKVRGGSCLPLHTQPHPAPGVPRHPHASGSHVHVPPSSPPPPRPPPRTPQLRPTGTEGRRQPVSPSPHTSQLQHGSLGAGWGWGWSLGVGIEKLCPLTSSLAKPQGHGVDILEISLFPRPLPESRRVSFGPRVQQVHPRTLGPRNLRAPCVRSRVPTQRTRTGSRWPRGRGAGLRWASLGYR